LHSEEYKMETLEYYKNKVIDNKTYSFRSEGIFVLNSELSTYVKIDEPSDLLMTAYDEQKAEFDTEKTSRTLKTEGELYTNTLYKVSFTSSDALGVLQVKTAFELGVLSTNIVFSNGTVMPIKATEFQDFVTWFVNKRNSFFI